MFRGLPKSARLAKRRQFLAVTDRRTAPDLKFSSALFLLLGRANGLDFNRLGVTVGKKAVPLAVGRNLIKRITREFFRLNTFDWAQGYDLVFIARAGAARAKKPELWESLARLGRKLAEAKRPGPAQSAGAPPEAAVVPRLSVPAAAFAALRDFLEWLCQGTALGLIHIYQRLISPLLPPSCRFHPTCSRYAVQAITIHGFRRGLNLTVRRLLKCHPFHPGGHDPVPPGKAGL